MLARRPLAKPCGTPHAAFAQMVSRPRILVAYNFDGPSEAALATAVDLASRSGRRLELLHVSGGSPVPVLIAPARATFGWRGSLRRDRTANVTS